MTEFIDIFAFALTTKVYVAGSLSLMASLAIVASAATMPLRPPLRAKLAVAKA